MIRSKCCRKLTRLVQALRRLMQSKDGLPNRPGPIQYMFNVRLALIKEYFLSKGGMYVEHQIRHDKFIYIYILTLFCRRHPFQSHWAASFGCVGRRGRKGILAYWYSMIETWLIGTKKTGHSIRDLTWTNGIFSDWTYPSKLLDVGSLWLCPVSFFASSCLHFILHPFIHSSIHFTH